MKVGLCGGRQNNKTYQNVRFYCDAEKADFNSLKKHFQIFWEIQGKSIYQVLLSMKLNYKNISLFVDNVLLNRFDIDFNKYLLLKNNALFYTLM